MKYEWVAFDNKYTSPNSKESLNWPPESWLKRVLYGPLIHSHLFLYFYFENGGIRAVLPKGRDSRCSYRQLLQVDSSRDHLKSWPRLSFLPQEVFFLAFVWPAFTNLLPDRFFEAACSCSGALSAADGARDAGDSCVASGAEAVNSDAAVSAYDS